MLLHLPYIWDNSYVDYMIHPWSVPSFGDDIRTSCSVSFLKQFFWTEFLGPPQGAPVQKCLRTHSPLWKLASGACSQSEEASFTKDSRHWWCIPCVSDPHAYALSRHVSSSSMTLPQAKKALYNRADLRAWKQRKPNKQVWPSLQIQPLWVVVTSTPHPWAIRTRLQSAFKNKH